MKKVFISLTIIFSIVMVSFSVYYQKTYKVFLAAEIVGFEIEDIDGEVDVVKNSNASTIYTSFKELGVVTYINLETNQFAALGHSLINSKDGTDIEGICYNVKFDADEENLKQYGEVYLNEKAPIGNVYYDNYSGIYGKINDISQKQYQEVETINRYHIKKGQASILIRLDGENLESYEVEIVAINYFESNKNIRIKITDQRLINETGGIVQGMSGTPVMQNGKLIGAINSVNIKDSTDAFAIFIDKII